MHKVIVVAEVNRCLVGVITPRALRTEMCSVSIFITKAWGTCYYYTLHDFVCARDPYKTEVGSQCLEFVQIELETDVVKFTSARLVSQTKRASFDH